MEESENFLQKPCKRKSRMQRSEKARKKRQFKEDKREKEHDDMYGGNY